MSTDQSATDRAQQAASTAAGEGQHVAGVAAEEARNVTAEAAQQAKTVAGQAVSEVQGQLGEQTRTQRDRLVGTLGTLGDDLHRMSEQADTGLAGDLTRELAGHVQKVTSHLDGREPADLLDDVRRFARERPGTFLLGALAAGVVAGRLARGVKDSAAAAAAPTTPAHRTPTTPVTPTPVPPTTPPVVSTPTAPAGVATGDPVPAVPGQPPAYGSDLAGPA